MNEVKCDKCRQLVDISELKLLPYLYKDMNCTKKPEIKMRNGERGYRQYEVCRACWEKEFGK